MTAPVDSPFWRNVAAGMSISDAVDDLLARIRTPNEFSGEWYNRPGMSRASQGFNFHKMGLQHGPESAYAKNLRAKAGV